MSQGKIVLMACGSFSPPTYMHLRMFEIAKDYVHSLSLGTIVGGIVSPVHDAYGKKDLVAASHRVAMLKLALRSSGWVKVSEWETQQTGWTRTRASMQYHQEILNNHAHLTDPPSWLPDDILNVNDIDDYNSNQLNGNTENVTVKLLCGADLLESFATPGLWSDEDLETILGQHGIVVVSRAGSDPGRFIYESDMLYKYRKNVILVTNYIVNEVSSTVLRRYLRTLPGHSEYNTDIEYDKSPHDVIMKSPEVTSFKNILISIRDRPSIVDETVTIKRAKKSIMAHTDTVTPIDKLKPKMAYIDKVSPSYVPGKAVKIVSDVTRHTFDKVSAHDTSSLDSFLDGGDLSQRRLSEGSVDRKTPKKRCSSSTIRKLKPDDMKKSKSEVSKLCDKVKSIKLKDESRNYKTRSCNDIVKLILTKHGIHVISDTEAIV
ncbi:nicotinamide/nicotinic acid mononucleotide adenylyltransferase 1 [Zerene cesonia]|uniref:nicotinamide/nicotinic acid mononucleotide adenylyltransferase 1 n=1 Tax=Zerene cesonia TaxID=33412 RepID=UPI0018E51709|nr:nicotinamide/nicotinic acid mononucleotide adenylyltransferase 1 [Zerene cesonia]